MGAGEERAGELSVRDQARCARALQVWYQHGVDGVARALKVTQSVAEALVEEGRRQFELSVMQDVEGERLRTALELSMQNEVLMGHVQKLRDGSREVRALDLRVMGEQKETRRRLNEVTGVEEKAAQGPTIVFLGHGFEGSEDEALAAKGLRPGDALVVETRAPWERGEGGDEPAEVVDGEAEEVTDDG